MLFALAYIGVFVQVGEEFSVYAAYDIDIFVVQLKNDFERVRGIAYNLLAFAECYLVVQLQCFEQQLFLVVEKLVDGTF